MKNYWLEKRDKKLLNQHQSNINEALKIYQNYPDAIVAKHGLAKSLYWVAEQVVNYQSWWGFDKDDLLQECVLVGLEKAPKFNWHKDCSFSYFVTCMMGHARQLCRSARNYNELKEKYREHLKK